MILIYLSQRTQADETEVSHKKRAAHDSTPATTEATNPTPQAPEASIPEPSSETTDSNTIKVESESSIKPEHTLPAKPTESTSSPAPEETTTEVVVSKYEEPQNRFRIYFDSPPELDRIPKAIRRVNNKRWRRESSSVAPGGSGYVPEAKENGEGESKGLEESGEVLKVEGDEGNKEIENG